MCYCFPSQTNCFNFTHNLLHVASANSWWNKVRLHQNGPSWCSYTNPSEVGCFPSPFWWFVFIKCSHNLPGMGSASARSSCNSMLYYPQRISSSHSVSPTRFLPGAMQSSFYVYPQSMTNVQSSFPGRLSKGSKRNRFAFKQFLFHPIIIIFAI